MSRNREVEEQFYICNGTIKTTELFEMDEVLPSPSVYEVIRVTASTPLFLEEHLERLNKSIALSGYTFKIDYHQLKQQIHQLIEANQSPEKNIKIIVNQLESEAPNVYLFFITSHYPSLQQYEEGVSSILYSAIRKNPNIKAVSLDQRELINAALKEACAYEAILVNENQEITEGSRSNIFLLKSNNLYTAPAKDVLLGITRERIMNLCNRLEIPVIEEPIKVDFLQGCEGLFLTGTSPKILPISLVDEQSFPSSNNPVIQRLQKAYDDLILDYISSYQG